MLHQGSRRRGNAVQDKDPEARDPSLAQSAVLIKYEPSCASGQQVPNFTSVPCAVEARPTRAYPSFIEPCLASATPESLGPGSFSPRATQTSWPRHDLCLLNISVMPCCFGNCPAQV
jgi:hypothetical protein